MPLNHPFRRNLTPKESRVLGLLQQLETAIGNRSLSATIYMSCHDANEFLESSPSIPIKVEYLDNCNSYQIVFDICEFKTYVHACCQSVGFIVGVYGNIITSDGLTLSYDEEMH